MPQVDRQ